MVVAHSTRPVRCYRSDGSMVNFGFLTGQARIFLDRCCGAYSSVCRLVFRLALCDHLLRFSGLSESSQPTEFYGSSKHRRQ